MSAGPLADISNSLAVDRGKRSRDASHLLSPGPSPCPRSRKKSRIGATPPRNCGACTCCSTDVSIYGSDDFPVFVVHSDISPLVKAKGTRKAYNAWLSRSTVDAIVSYGTCECRGGHDARRGLYLGAGFSCESLGPMVDDLLLSLQAALKEMNVILVVNVGRNHWVLLELRTDGQAYLYDPMWSSSVHSSLLVFVARVCGEHPHDDLPLDRSRRISVRKELEKVKPACFHLVNTELQLKEKEGYNCGMYVAMWARALAMHGENAVLKEYTREELVSLRQLWHDVLLPSSGGKGRGVLRAVGGGGRELSTVFDSLSVV